MKKISKRIIALMLAVIMAMPTVLAMPFAAEAEDAPSSAYWQILASTDFTGTAWSGSGSSWYASTSPTTSAGGHSLGWNINYNDSESGVTVNSKGVNFHYNSNSDREMGFMYLSSFKIGNTIYNSSNYKALFDGISSFKIDLAFSYLGTAKAATGNALDQRRGNNTFLKLANDTGNKLGHSSKYNYQSNYFCQEPWGRRHFNNNNDVYATGNSSGGTQEGGAYAITTSDNLSSGGLTANSTYHYVVYVADGWLGCYVADASGNLVINYDSIKLSDLNNFGLTPADITSIYLGGSEWNWAGKYELDNVAYKSIEIYKGVDTSTYDSSRTKYLYAYFTGNNEAGETMHYAISQDGLNFETVNGGAKVWDGSEIPATETYPTADSAPYSDSVAISNHVRDSYAFIGQDGKCYVIATDLNTNNGDWGNIQNSRFLMWKMDAFADISETRPWTIDTANITGMDAVTGATSSSHKTVKKAWAPQVLWDADEGKYMLYWSVGADGISTQIYYTYTSDFKTDFTAPKRLLEPSKSYATSGMDAHIDADITYHNGLYYCFFKNEDGSGTGAKRIWYAVSSRANGPYSGFTLFNTSYGAEGPQVFETAENSYLLMVDGYGDGSYHMYSSGSLSGFSTSNESSTNIGNISPRHGSILRISDSEYSKLKKLRTGGAKYKWETVEDHSNGARNGWSQTDSAGKDYVVAYYYDRFQTGNGVLTLTNGGAYTQDSDIKSYVSSGEFSISVFYKSSASTTKDDDHTIISVSKGNDRYNYIRVSTNGKFFINGAQVTPANSARSTAFANAVNDTENFHKFTITYNGTITALIIDGQYICGQLGTVDIQNDNWITLGWGRGSFEDNRLSAQFGQLTVKPFATDTNAEDEFYDSVKPANINVGSFGVQPYHKQDAIPSAAYSNIIYSPKDTTSWSGNGSGDTATGVGRIDFKVAIPRRTVLVYDGISGHDPISPIMVESKCNNTGGSAHIIHYVKINSSECFKLVQNWQGYGKDWTKWAANSISTNESFSYIDDNSASPDTQRDGNSRFWWNKLVFDTAYFTNHSNTYYAKDTNISFYAHTSYKSGGRQNKYGTFTSVSDNYVINYKPVVDIIKAGSTVTVGGTSVNMATLFANDADNRWMYTKASYAQAIYAMKLLSDCNPNKFLSNSTAAGDVETQVTACANAIKKAVEEFNKISLVKNTFSVQYRMADGRTIAETVTAGDTLAKVPSASSIFHIDGTDTHMTNIGWSSISHDDLPSGATWSNPSATPSNSVVPRANTVYTESGTPTDCNHNTAQTHVAATEELNGYTDYACSACGYINATNRVWDQHTAEWATYVNHANAVSGNAANTGYTTSSRSTYQSECNTITNGVTANDVTIPVSIINAKNTAFDTAEGKLDPCADVATLNSSYNTADSFIKGLEGQDATYTEESIQAIIDALGANGVSTYYNADTSDLSGKTYQTTIDNLKSAISTAYEGREEVDFPEESVTGYEAAYEKLEKLDTDAYEENEGGSIAAAKRGAEALFTTVNYAGKTINVVAEDVESGDMDEAITTMLSALRNCVKMYNISTDSGVGEISANNGTYYIKDNKAPFGTKLNFTANDPETVWYLKVDSGTMHRKNAFQGFGSRLEVKTVGNVTVTTKTRGANQKRVRITRTYDNATSQAIQLVDFVDDSFGLPAAPAIAYYNFSGYYLKGSDERLDNPSNDYPQNISITADTEIVAKYTYNGEASCAVNATTLEGGSVSKPDAVAYNSRIDLKGGNNAYGWSVDLGNGNYRPFYVGADLTMYASDSMNLVAEDEKTFNAHGYALPNIYLRSGTVTSGTKTTFNAQVVAVDMDKVKEYGILIGAPSSKNGYTARTPLDSEIVLENSGQQEGYAILRAKSTKLVGANQFTIAINNLPSGYKYRGYLIYEDSEGNLQTEYTDVV